MSQKKNFQDTSTPVVNRKRRESKPTPPEREFSKRTHIMNSPDNSQHQDLSFIQDNQPPLPQSTSPSQFSSSQPNPVNCSLSQDDVCKIACKLKEMLRSEIDYTIKSTIDHYKGEIFRLNSENEKLREDLDDLEQYGRRELMRINGIPDGGQQETTANTTKLVTDLIKSIDPDLNESDIIRSHRIGNPVRVGEHGRALPPRQIIVRLKDSNVKKRILKCRKNLKDKPEYRSVNINEDLTKIRNGIAYRARQLKKLKLVTDTWTIDGKIFVKVRDRVVLVNNVTALNKLASEIGRDAIKVINDINTKSSEHNRPRSSQGLTRVKEHPQSYASAATPNHAKSHH